MSDELLSINPSTGQIIWRGATGDAPEAVARARQAFPRWRRTDLSERIALARGYQEAVRGRAEEFARLIAAETGKPLWEARTEVQSCVAKVDISIAAQAERAGTRVSEPGAVCQAVRHKPHGILAVLGPYNFPAHLPNGHIVPALLAGNMVIFKPSEKTPATADMMRQCWLAAGLPDHVLQIVHGGSAEGKDLAEHREVDGVLFTGSARAGAAIHRAFADTPDRILAIEAGGNNPLVVWNLPPEQLESAARTIVQSAFLSAGQRCTCARRLVIGDESGGLVDRVASLSDRLIIGDAFDEPQPFMGPVIDNAAADMLELAFEHMITAGARVIRPLRRIFPDRPFLAPGILDVTGIDRADEELFGPVLQIVRVPDFDGAIAEANATRFGLSAALLGGDRLLFDRFWAESRAGIVNWNRPTNGAASNAPFGGVGASGNHRPSAYYAADYCAWPVAGLEAETIEIPALQGLRDETGRGVG